MIGHMKFKDEPMSANNASTTYRQWLILQHVSRSRWIGTTELQQILQREGIDINLRTIQRDLNTLADHFPLENNGLSPQGWRWKTDAPAMQLPHMTSSQALTFLMVEQHLQNLMPASVLGELRPWFDNARQQSRQGGSRVHRWMDMVRIAPSTQPLIPPAIDSDALHTIQEALLTRRRLDVLYESRSKQEALNLDIDPLALVQRGPVMYLIAGRKGHEGVRRFALHRFKKAWIRDEKVQKPADFELDEYLAKGGMGFGKGEMIKLQAVFTREAGEHLYESRLSEDQVITEMEDGQLLVEATVADTPQLRWWLRAVGINLKN